MGTRPTKAADNIYCKCRLEAAKYNDRLNSREGAAELLGVSPSSLADYELGNTKIIPVDKIILMADLYKAPEIKNYYCKNVCPIGCDFPEVLEDADLDRLTIKTVSALKDAKWISDTLIKIVADGIIDEAEKSELETIMKTLDEFMGIYQSLKVYAEKNVN